jgi:ABC-2 type transport system ATP-binding protein
MLGDPRVLILDEPANGLDPEGIRWLRDLLKGLASAGRTVLVSSHLLSEMQILAEDIVIIAAGRLVAQGPMAELVNTVATSPTVRVRTPQPDRLIQALPAATVTGEPDGVLLLAGVDVAAVSAAARRRRRPA